MVKITDEMRRAVAIQFRWHEQGRCVSDAISALAPLIIAQYEAEKAAAAAPVPFAITSMDQKVQYVTGTPARLLAVDLPGKWPILSCTPSGVLWRHEADGKSATNTATNIRTIDLIPIPPAERVAYVNVYPNEAFSLYATRAEADMRSFPNRTGCNRLILKEGVWDE
jgi:hypothetical protein